MECCCYSVMECCGLECLPEALHRDTKVIHYCSHCIQWVLSYYRLGFVVDVANFRSRADFYVCNFLYTQCAVGEVELNFCVQDFPVFPDCHIIVSNRKNMVPFCLGRQSTVLLTKHLLLFYDFFVFSLFPR